jgi:hypothetical protein
MAPSPEDLVELYAAANAVEARRVVLFLEDEGIEALTRDTTGTAFPSDAGSQVLVLAPSGARERAAAIIRAAIQDGAISSGGQLLA